MQQQQYLSNDEELVLELKKGHLCQDVEWVPTLVEQLKDDGLMNRETAASVAVSGDFNCVINHRSL